MTRKRKINDYGTGIPYHEAEALARVPLPEIQAFSKSEKGQQEFAEWNTRQETGTTEQTQHIRREHLQRCSRLIAFLQQTGIARF